MPSKSTVYYDKVGSDGTLLECDTAEIVAKPSSTSCNLKRHFYPRQNCNSIPNSQVTPLSGSIKRDYSNADYTWRVTASIVLRNPTGTGLVITSTDKALGHKSVIRHP